MLARSRALETLQGEVFDLLVIGGGITGAGVALDAASRGYSVALVEQTDYAAGTSSRSSKLVHGGLRYLQNFDLGLVREALLERRLMVKLAPHLVRPLPMVVPAFGGARPDRLVGIGLNMYDVMSTPRLRGRREARRAARQRPSRAQREEEEPDSDWSPDRHRTIAGPEVEELLPALAAREPTGGYLFYDCQTDDVRLVLTVLGEAERFGAICANRLRVVELLDGARGPGATAGETSPERGVRALDLESDQDVVIRAANVINATGVWADQIRPEELEQEAEVPKIAPSRGTHLLLATADLPLRAGAIVPAGEGRSIFALPWMGRSLLGTTDNNYSGPIEHVKPAEEDVEYLLKATNAFFESDYGTSDLVGAYAGVRPLISTGDMRKSVDISRKAELYETSSGLITITGGKLTTWRRMAKLAVDRLVERDGREAPCRTQEIPLGEPIDPDELPRVEAVQPDSYDRLAHRYGHAAVDVLAVAGEREELAARIVPDLPDLLAEAAFSARHEQAGSVGDVLLRRTRVGLLAGRELVHGNSDAPRRVAQALGQELGWSAERVQAEIENFREEADAEGIGA
ncbi:MAG: FAD-dependent oxidoreductase [Solirubrobacteraceae bacterium]